MTQIKSKAIKDYNVSVVKQSGRVGTVRYYVKNGLTYVRAASNSQVTNNRTNAQMLQRLLFASLGAVYSTLGQHLRGAFPLKAKNQTDFNAFMQANQGTGVYLSKQEKALGYSVALPVVVASGKLKAITGMVSDGQLVSDIQIGNISLESATVADLAAAIVAGNEGWSYGDQLTIVILRQEGNYCRPQYVRIALDRTSTALLSAFGTFASVDSCLAYAISGDVCAGFIHSQADGGMSFCRLAATESMITIINSYLTDEVFAAAAASYGTATQTFLVPGSEGDVSAKKTLSLAASPEAGGNVTGAGKYAVGSNVDIAATANSGYQFVRWSDGSTDATRTLTLTSDLTLLAIFQTE